MNKSVALIVGGFVLGAIGVYLVAFARGGWKSMLLLAVAITLTSVGLTLKRLSDD